MITRQNTPGPWHDAVAYAYELYWLAPNLAAAKYGLSLDEMKAIHRRCRRKRKKKVKIAA